MLCAEPDLMGSRQTGVRVRPASKDTAPVGFRGIEQCLADLLRFRRRDAFQPAPICRGRLRFEASPIFQERVSRGKLGSLRLGRGCRFQTHVFSEMLRFGPTAKPSAVPRFLPSGETLARQHENRSWLANAGVWRNIPGKSVHSGPCLCRTGGEPLSRVAFSGCMSKAASMGFAVFEPAMRRRRDRDLRSLLAG